MLTTSIAIVGCIPLACTKAHDLLLQGDARDLHSRRCSSRRGSVQWCTGRGRTWLRWRLRVAASWSTKGKYRPTCGFTRASSFSRFTAATTLRVRKNSCSTVCVAPPFAIIMSGLSNAFASPWLVVDIIVRGLSCIMPLAKSPWGARERVGSLDLKMDRRVFASL